jgi:hypothetical protein
MLFSICLAPHSSTRILLQSATTIENIANLLRRFSQFQPDLLDRTFDRLGKSHLPQMHAEKYLSACFSGIAPLPPDCSEKDTPGGESIGTSVSVLQRKQASFSSSL